MVYFPRGLTLEQRFSPLEENTFTIFATQVWAHELELQVQRSVGIYLRHRNESLV